MHVDIARRLRHRHTAILDQPNRLDLELATETPSSHWPPPTSLSHPNWSSVKPAAAQKAKTWAWLTHHSRTGKSAVYGYHLPYESPYTPVASHGADHPFVFSNLVPQFFAPKAPPAGPADRALSDVMMAYWVNFAGKGNPNGPGLPRWPEFNARNALLKFGTDGRTTASPPSERQIARFKFLDGFLISASSGQRQFEFGAIRTDQVRRGSRGCHSTRPSMSVRSTKMHQNGRKPPCS